GQSTERARTAPFYPYLKRAIAVGRGHPEFAVERQRDLTEAVMENTREHRYVVSFTWSGNLGSGTSGYRDYSRDYEIRGDGKVAIHGSAHPAFRGDRSRWNPEELLVASLSACHKLWYLHLATEAGITVTAYTDRPEGVMEVGRDGVGR